MKVWANKVQVHQPVQVPTFNSILQKKKNIYTLSQNTIKKFAPKHT